MNKMELIVSDMKDCLQCWMERGFPRGGGFVLLEAGSEESGRFQL